MTTTAATAAADPAHAVPAPLKAEALALLRDAFDRHGHRPSNAQWQALEALLDTFDGIVLGSAMTPALYLSALDPGVGKTSALVAYLTALLRSEDHRGVGVLVTLSRLTEIKRLAEELRQAGSSVAVRTSDENLNALSSVADPKDAQVLIITQQRLELVCEGKSFGDVASLHFGGQPRVLRVWDEAFLPGQPIAVSSDDLAAVLGWLRRKSRDFHGWVEGIRDEAKAAADGQVIHVPVHDFLDQQMTLGDALRPLRAKAEGGDTLAERDMATLTALWRMAGRAVTVRKDDALGPTLVSFARTLPEDLLPLVVLDASARVRKTYDLMAEVMPVRRLPSATKDYSALTIRVWRRGGGKVSMRNKEKFTELVQVLSGLVTDEGGKGWLVVGHKAAHDIPDLGEAMRRQLGAEASNVAFLTWGQHSATNDHADKDRVILAGTLFLRPSDYEALARASVLKDPDERVFSMDELQDLTLGEHGHLVLQALCRAAVRKAHSGAAAACEAYLVATKRSGIEELLPDLFPGCRVEQWKPTGPKLTGHAKAVFDLLLEWAKDAPEGAEIKFARVYGTLGINADVFRKQVRGNKDLQEALAALGVYEDGTEIRRSKYRLDKKRVSHV